MVHHPNIVGVPAEAILLAITRLILSIPTRSEGWGHDPKENEDLKGRSERPETTRPISWICDV